MKNKTIIFIPFHFRHWEMYLPLVKPLEEKGFDVYFVVIDGFHYIHHHPNKEVLQKLNIKRIELSERGSQSNKIKFFKIIFNELLPVWEKILDEIGRGIVISPDYASLHRMMLKESRRKGFINVTLQDGAYIGKINKYGSSLENKFAILAKKILSITPLIKFINLEFGASSDFCGVFGEAVKERLCSDSGFNPDRVEVTGSSRFAEFRQKVLNVKSTDKRDEFNVLCLPTNFDFYKNKKLEDSQVKALKWVSDTVSELRKELNVKINLYLKLKKGYDHLLKNYKSLLQDESISFLTNDISFEELIAGTDIVINSGGTSALEAIICNIPVVQVAPKYLYENLTYFNGLPIAKDINELHFYLKEAISKPGSYCNTYFHDVSNELADIDPNWNSVIKITHWIDKLSEKIYNGKRISD